MPAGGTNRVEIAVCSIPALLAMKGHAINGRYKQKDSYDVYYCIRNYPDGIESLAEACRPLLHYASARTGFAFIAEKFETTDGYGPTCVRRFVEDTSWGIARRTNGSRMHLGKSMLGCALWA